MSHPPQMVLMMILPVPPHAWQVTLTYVFFFGSHSVTVPLPCRCRGSSGKDAHPVWACHQFTCTPASEEAHARGCLHVLVRHHVPGGIARVVVQLEWPVLTRLAVRAGLPHVTRDLAGQSERQPLLRERLVPIDQRRAAH